MLQDINPTALDLVFARGQRVLDLADSHITLEQTTSQEAALPGSDFVILTITTGGLEAMRYDLEIPEKYGIFQSVGDTVGPDGLARGLRNIPVVVEIAHQIEALAPQA